MGHPGVGDLYWKARVRLALVLLVVSVFWVGCSPTMTPLYRDFEVQADAAGTATDGTATDGTATAGKVLLSEEAILDRIRAGFQEAEWPVSEGVTENTIETEPRTYRRWGIYNVQVHLEVVPIGGHYVRVMVHPYRVFFNDRSRQIGYLRGSLARSIMKDIQDPFEEQGLKFAGFAQARDAAALKR